MVCRNLRAKAGLLAVFALEHLLALVNAKQFTYDNVTYLHFVYTHIYLFTLFKEGSTISLS